MESLYMAVSTRARRVDLMYKEKYQIYSKTKVDQLYKEGRLIQPRKQLHLLQKGN